MLTKNPVFTIIVLVVLGLGVGANTAIFGVWDRVILRPLPVHKPHELVKVECYMTIDNGKYFATSGQFRYSDYEKFSGQSRLFTGMLAYGGHGKVNLRDQDGVYRAEILAVSGNYFEVFGVRPCLGRTFAAEDGRISAEQPVAVISHALWRRRFGGHKEVVGQQVTVDNLAVTIIGVAPPKFTGRLLGLPDIYIPLNAWARLHNITLSDYQTNLVHLIGRLKPGINRAQAEARLRVVAGWIAEGDPEEIQSTVLLSPANRQKLSGVKQASYPLPLLMTASVMLLLIVCANIANMQLVRGTTRCKEIAIRQAMGASRMQIIRQLLIESLLLTVLGGICGVVLALWLDRLLCAFLSATSFFQFAPGLDVRTPGFALGASLATGVAFGLTPALQTTRFSVTPALKTVNTLAQCSIKGRTRFRYLLIAQIAVSVPVLILGGLCARGLLNLRKEDPGFDPARVITIRPNLAREAKDLPMISQCMFDLRERIKAMPPVRNVSLAGCVPLGESSGVRGIKHIEGAERTARGGLHWIYNAVDSDYFETLGVRILRGRSFTRHDGLQSNKVTLINEVIAQRFWPTQNPIGKRVTVSTGRTTTEIRQIVGVVETVKLRSIREQASPTMYLPIAQCSWYRNPDHPLSVPSLLVRAQGDPWALIPGIRSLIESSSMPIDFRIETVADQLHNMLYPQRVITGALTLLGLVGMLLSATGIYGVLAFMVRKRTREIGIRMTLGALKRDVVLPILGQGIGFCGIGLLLGLGLSLCVTRILNSRLSVLRDWDRNFLFGVQTWDVLTFAGAALLVMAVALLACYVPARQAARIDPMEALRYE